MERIIEAGGVKIPAKATAASLFLYKANFGQDGVTDIIKLEKMLPAILNMDESSEAIDSNLVYRFLWSLAKNADKGIPPLEEWLGGFDVSPVSFFYEALPQVYDILVASSMPTVKPKN